MDDVNVKELTGSQILRALEQSLTFERGILQLSGLQMIYDLSQPKYQRIVSLTHDGQLVKDTDRFTVAAPSFLTEGGDLYDSFPESELIRSVGKVSDVMISYFQEQNVVSVPERGRQWTVDDGQ